MKRINEIESSTVFDKSNIIGSTVYVSSVTMSNCRDWTYGLGPFTVKQISYRISIDGKCITLFELSEIPDKIFTVKDLTFKSINV